jgi:branched-chain amino acid transport system substrate-binding protein
MLLKQIMTVIITLSLVMISSCHPLGKEERKRTAEKADKKDKDIVIALVESSKETNTSLFKKGALLAIDELNQKGGILVERKIIPLEYDDQGDPDVGKKIAIKIAHNLDVIAVIGHRLSSVAIPVSITYEKEGIVFISIGSTTPMLTARKNQYIFRNIPNDEDIGKALAEFAKRQGFKNILVLFERGDYGRRLSEFFKEEAIKQGMTIFKTRSYFNKERDFRALIEGAQTIDAIFLAAFLPKAAEVIKQTRSMGIYAPFISGDSLENPGLWDNAEMDAIGTYVASVFDPDYSKKSKAFVKRFQDKYKQPPDAKAAQGYDAVNLIAWAIENNRTTVPIEIATALRYMKKWENVVGPYRFKPNGDITSRTIHIKVLSPSGQFKKIK